MCVYRDMNAHGESAHEERVFSQLCQVSLVIAYYPKTMNKRKSSNDQELVHEKNLIQRNAKFSSWK